MPWKSTMPLAARFWAKVDVRGPDECWLWKRCIAGGYGRFGIGSRSDGTRKSERASRVALTLHLGRELSAGMLACHRCDNPECCNPAHLFEGTVQDNAQDCAAKGRTNKPSGEDHWTFRTKSSPAQRLAERTV